MSVFRIWTLVVCLHRRRSNSALFVPVPRVGAWQLSATAIVPLKRVCSRLRSLISVALMKIGLSLLP